MNATALLKFFYASFRDAKGAEHPASWKTHASIFANLRRVYDDNLIRNMVMEYFLLTDRAVVNSGHSIFFFPSQVPRLLEILDAKKRTVKVSTDNFDRLQKLNAAF